MKISVQILYFKDGWYSFRTSCDCGPRKCTSIFIEVVEHSWKSSVQHINIVESGKENSRNAPQMGQLISLSFTDVKYFLLMLRRVNRDSLSVHSILWAERLTNHWKPKLVVI